MKNEISQRIENYNHKEWAKDMLSGLGEESVKAFLALPPPVGILMIIKELHGVYQGNVSVDNLTILASRNYIELDLLVNKFNEEWH